MKPTCILAMPSSGSDWFVDCYQKASGLNYFHKEWFNPMCNVDCPGGFGSECVSNYKFIAAPQPVDEAMNKWKESGYELNKEVFCGFNVEWFASRFNCLTLVRSAEATFPPGRLRVYQWYDAIWHSLTEAGYSLRAETVRDRAVEAHGVMRHSLIESSDRLQIPIISYDEIMGCDTSNVKAALKAAWFAAETVVQTRLLKTKNVE